MKKLLEEKLDKARKEYNDYIESGNYVGDELYLQGRYDAFFELMEELNDQND